MLTQAKTALCAPTLDEVLKLANELELPKPIANREVFNVWFLALHELGHHAVKPKWYRDYAEVIYWDNSPKDKPCAPLAPDLWMLSDPTPDEDCVRLWCLQVCDRMGWINPILENPSIFGGSHYNPRQWYVMDEDKLADKLLSFGVNVAAGQLVSAQEDIGLPHPEGRSLTQLLENQDYIYRYFEVPWSTCRNSTPHLTFLTHLCKQIA
ncbi:hypothetical protein IFO70_18950 [Phormidium tenue FACHB-886]|nr:hypothetical protein [Phormidium tenue FACHB-886]